MLRSIITFAVLAVSLWLLYSRRLRHDVVGALSAIVLIAAGIVSPETLLQDLSSTAVIVLIAAMVISGVLSASGVLDVVGDRIALAVRNEYLAVVLVLLAVTLLSGFVSDVAVMLAFAPVISAIASRFKKSASRYLMALSYAAIAGGRYTMIGTSSNIILESLWISRFGETLNILAPLRVGLWEAIGVTLAAAVLAPLIIRARGREKASIEELGPREYVIEIELAENSPIKDVRELEDKLGVKVVEQRRRRLRSIRARKEVESGLSGKILVRLPKERIPMLLSEGSVKTELGNGPLYELLVPSGSSLVNNTVMEVNRWFEGVKIVGVSTNARVQNLQKYALNPGDVILVQGNEENVVSLAEYAGLIPLRATPLKVLDKRVAAAGFIGLLIAVLGSLAGLNVALSFIVGALATVVASPNMLKRAYSFVDWSVIVFVGTYMTVGQALLHTGLWAYLSSIANYPLALFAASLALSNLVGNAAAASILGPLAVYSSNPLPAVVAVAMGASSTFLTPASHPCNMIAYSFGGYDPKDFTRLGAIAVLVVAVITVLFISGYL